MSLITATFDIETDPFSLARATIEPFATGFFDGQEFHSWWGEGCIDEFKSFLDAEDKADRHYRIYAHNGGKFDYKFLVQKGMVLGDIKIIGGRFVKFQYRGHEFRDSFSIIPVPLSAYQKDEISYELFERNLRDRHRGEIISYLAGDCRYLHELVSAFLARFGPKLTIGGTAIDDLRAKTPTQLAKTDQQHDEKFRPWYFGGRCEALRTGVFEGEFTSYDVNSMYPYVMSETLHPVGKKYLSALPASLDSSGQLIGMRKDIPYFAEITATNRGAFPLRTKSGLSFRIPHGRFFTTSHEIRAALDTDTATIETVHNILVPYQSTHFRDFVHTHINDKIKATQEGDSIKRLAAKLLMNSAYGKFAQNPTKFKDYKMIDQDSEDSNSQDLNDWGRVKQDLGSLELWHKDAANQENGYLDVATAASITGAARAVMIRALKHASQPLYCDTDSILCRCLNTTTDSSALGAWAVEATGNRVAIGGKKMYALFQNQSPIKTASKGVRLAPEDIVKVAQGEKVEWLSPVPVFDIFGRQTRLKRVVKRTLENLG